MLEALRKYFLSRRLILPILVEIVTISASRLSPRNVIYFMAGFYLFLIVYFAPVFCSKPVRKGKKRRKDFLIHFFVTALAALVAFFMRKYVLLLVQKSWHNDGVIDIIWKNNVGSIFFYALTFMILMPLGETLFFRFALIKLSSVREAVLSSIFSILLLLPLHADSIHGILPVALPALAITVCYCIFKNIYAVLAVYIIFCVHDSFENVAYSLARLYLR